MAVIAVVPSPAISMRWLGLLRLLETWGVPFFANRPGSEYNMRMADLKFEEQATEEVEVDPETLAAIDRGLEDLKAGRTVSLDEVRERVRQWTSNSHSPNRP